MPKPADRGRRHVGLLRCARVDAMLDVLFIGIAIGFIVACTAFVFGCEKL